jgi:alkyldihydroxyacetonephosphate synthase
VELVKFLKDIEELLGKDNVISEGHGLSMFRRDWWSILMLREALGHSLDSPPAVIRPGSINDAINVVKLANKYGICLVPYGGGSSVVGGAYHNGCVVIDMSRLNKILDFSEEDLTITVEAGAKMINVEKWLNERGYTLDYHPQSFQLLTVGGAIGHGSTGSHSASNIEELVLSMDILLPNGDPVSVGPGTYVRVSWPDMRRLFIGSEGALGIVVRATLRVKPLANYYVDRAFVFNNIVSAIKFARDMAIRLPGPYRVVIHDKDSSKLMIGEDMFVALIRIRRHDEELVNAEASIVSKLARHHGGSEVSQDLVKRWRIVFAKDYESQLMQLVNQGLWVETIDTATTWSRLPGLYAGIKGELKEVDGVIYVLPRITHIYLNGASLYSVVVLRQDENTYWRIWHKTFEITSKVGATITHHHGTGLLKRDYVKLEMNQQWELLRKIKDVLDVKMIMNPGKIL